MRKLVVVCLMCVLLFGALAACEDGNGMPSGETTEATTEATEPKKNTITPSFEDANGVKIGGYYSLCLPEDWEGEAEYKVTGGEHNTYSVSFFCSKDVVAGNGGELFTLCLYPAGEDYSSLPSYKKLSHIEGPNICADLVICYPTDVQFGPETAVIYGKLANKVEEVLSTLTYDAALTVTK